MKMGLLKKCGKYFAVNVCGVLLALFFMIGLPYLLSGDLKSRIIAKGTDAKSSASIAVEEPSGEYFVYINKKKHDEASLAVWKDFFGGGEVPIIFEDLSCYVAKGDENAYTLAESYASRLPENQMIYQEEEATMLFSKLRAGRLDIVIVSAEAAASYGLSSLDGWPGIEKVIVVTDQDKI